MSKICIFDGNKNCNNCNECDLCELNNNKTCDNCGKCLQLEGYDVKAIEYIDALDDENNWSYLEDIDKIKEFLENGEDISSLGSEVFPGLISLKNPNNN